ncbi:hypothetical protein MGU_05569 [Metarhizium guizhouense ARSEF 977]|uniref:Uncharacterized protein n=1 Tax=Metarhizium guizhouense (strain ARSEF 977) TaxID=1276136 RepID=A0A0B4I3H3_METGA|nr:hypothetical protein MGU_05569 [Metarhizium guizhouense ARSEF 977]
MVHQRRRKCRYKKAATAAGCRRHPGNMMSRRASCPKLARYKPVTVRRSAAVPARKWYPPGRAMTSKNPEEELYTTTM